MVRRIIFSIIVLLGLIIIQTTFFKYLPFNGITPDIAMLALLFISHRNGGVSGQVCGFASGLFEDFLSISPLGFHTLVKTATGFIYGNTSGRIFIDPFMMPIVFAVTATLIKGILANLLSFVFAIQINTPSIISFRFLIELGLNAVLAPIIFFLTGLLRFLYPIRREDAL